jgi:hypothetical protein
MRLRSPLLAGTLAALASVAAVPGANAAPLRDHGLTIHAQPRLIAAGEGVIIFGRLTGPDRTGQRIVLFHRIAGAPGFTPISTTRTNGLGEYEFTRAEGIVLTNRSWFVRGVGVDRFAHSATLHERVASLVSLAASTTSPVTRRAVVFSGHVTPDHAGGVVLLQQQRGSSDDWQTIARGRIGADSNFAVSHAWRYPGATNVRALVPGDARNVAAPSDPVALVVEQNQAPGFTINSSSPIITEGQSATISGQLAQAGATSPAGATLSLLGTGLGGGRPLQVLQTTSTGSDGSYSFSVAPTTNEVYEVRISATPRRHSARLVQGVQDAVTMSASSPSSTVDGLVTFSGTVAPGKAGHVIYLQKLGADRDWHTVAVTRVAPGSTFRFGWRFGTAGTKQFRARITGGDVNVGGASAPVTVAVSQSALASLPQS